MQMARFTFQSGDFEKLLLYIHVEAFLCNFTEFEGASSIDLTEKLFLKISKKATVLDWRILTCGLHKLKYKFKYEYKKLRRKKVHKYNQS